MRWMNVSLSLASIFFTFFLAHYWLKLVIHTHEGSSNLHILSYNMDCKVLWFLFVLSKTFSTFPWSFFSAQSSFTICQNQANSWKAHRQQNVVLWVSGEERRFLGRGSNHLFQTLLWNEDCKLSIRKGLLEVIGAHD